MFENIRSALICGHCSGLKSARQHKKHLSGPPQRRTLGLRFYPAGVHELSIMESALAMALLQAQQAGARRVLVIRLRVGALSGVVPEALQFAFEALAPGTPVDGANLVIERVPARFWCGACAKEFTADDMFADCPDCHTPSTELRAGRELQVSSLEIE